MQKSAKRPAPRPTPPGGARPKRPRPKKRASSNVALILALALALTVGLYFIQSALPAPDSGVNRGPSVPLIDVAGTVRVTEVMSSNASALQDDKGNYADWIEITNVSDEPFNLKGWKLAKDSSIMLKYFEFPNHTLAPGECAIVFCTSTTSNAYGYGYHAPFKISAAGDTLLLYNASDTAVQSLNIPEMTANQVYAEWNGEWIITDEYTPALANTHANHQLLMSNRQVAESPIRVTELMAKNVSYAPDENGEYVDWIEVYNSSNYAVSLNGYALSDSLTNINKWRFPNVSIGPGEYMIVYASGYDRRVPGAPMHTNFKLSTEKEGVILTNAAGQIIDIVEYDLLGADQSYSRQADDTWTTLLSPTPGMSNSFASAALIDSQFAAQNSVGVFINEIMASTTIKIKSSDASSYDWIELRNASGQAVDLSGWGLSDDPSAPRKWQFPAGAKIQPGAFMGVYVSGLDSVINNQYHTNFKLSASGGETLVLSKPDGTIIDRAYLSAQYSNIPYGRINGKQGFYYLTAATPGSSNVTSGYEARTTTVKYSEPGGLYPADARITLALTCEEGATIYYTLDSSDPDPAAVGGRTYTPDPTVVVREKYETYVYTSPITISSTTVVRAIAVKNGQINSLSTTQTYFVGVSHTMPVVSLVTAPANLWDYYDGMYVPGQEHDIDPSSANYLLTLEKGGNVELFGLDGETMISQGCALQLQGEFSRKENQKAFKVIARSAYGKNLFESKLFPNRDYTEYQSFVLRASGQDIDKIRFRDALLTSLAEGTGVMYQDTRMVIVYLNGEYWGHYNMRERINGYSICQWEGWDVSIRDSLDIIKVNTRVLQGSVTAWTDIRTWVEKNGVETAEKLAYLEQFVDVDSYLNLVALQIYTGNTDLGNNRKYRTDLTDGKWRWVFYDLDWSYNIDTNSPGRWLTPGGVGTSNRRDNLLFIQLMKNPECRDKFLTFFGQKLATDWTTENMLSLIDKFYKELEPELDQHLQRWGVSRTRYDNELSAFKKYAQTRPGRLLYFFNDLLSAEDMVRYFGESLKTVDLLDINMNKVEFDWP